MELTMNNLTRQFGSKTAVNHMSMSLTPGVYGLLGANGAGKTTLMRMLCGVLNPISGSICLDGHSFDFWQIWKRKTDYCENQNSFSRNYNNFFVKYGFIHDNYFLNLRNFRLELQFADALIIALITIPFACGSFRKHQVD